jgi:hypothetical protein
MTFNQKHGRFVNNLDAAHDALLDAGDRERLEVEEMENEILGDEELFERLARLYLAEEHGPSFLEFGIEQLRREREPEHTRAWEVNP